VLLSGALRINKITIIGTENIAAGKLEELVKGEMAIKKYGFLPGDSFLFQDKEALKKKIKENFTEVESANISLVFPDEIILDIKEKNTALIWCRDACYFVNEKGVAFFIADEGRMIKEQKRFVKIIEEADIAEETEEERKAIMEEAGGGEAESADAKEDGIKNAEDGSGAEDIEAENSEESPVLPPITLNEKVADENFIGFAVKVGELLENNTKIKLKYFKTKGYRTREIIGFTSQNTRLYFDTTKSAEKQVKNMNYLLKEVIGEEKIDTLQYIYLKNEDRVFYK